jgi:hypothetical protein
MKYQELHKINKWFMDTLDIEPMASELVELADGIILEKDFEITISGVDIFMSDVFNDSYCTYEMPFGNKTIFVTLN